MNKFAKTTQPLVSWTELEASSPKLNFVLLYYPHEIKDLNIKIRFVQAFVAGVSKLQPVGQIWSACFCKESLIAANHSFTCYLWLLCATLTSLSRDHSGPQSLNCLVWPFTEKFTKPCFIVPKDFTFLILSPQKNFQDRYGKHFYSLYFMHESMETWDC